MSDFLNIQLFQHRNPFQDTNFVENDADIFYLNGLLSILTYTDPIQVCFFSA